MKTTQILIILIYLLTGTLAQKLKTNFTTSYGLLRNLLRRMLLNLTFIVKTKEAV